MTPAAFDLRARRVVLMAIWETAYAAAGVAKAAGDVEALKACKKELLAAQYEKADIQAAQMFPFG